MLSCSFTAHDRCSGSAAWRCVYLNDLNDLCSARDLSSRDFRAFSFASFTSSVTVLPIMYVCVRMCVRAYVLVCVRVCVVTYNYNISVCV